MTYEEWRIKFEKAFKDMSKYTYDQAGSSIYAEELGKLADEYPEYESRYDEEPEAYCI